jgi:two-component system, chemotaxis family, sensor kinase CheA
VNDEIVREFLVEGNENLDALDRELMQLRKDPRSRATLASAFRTIHAINGSYGFVGFGKLEAGSHAGKSFCVACAMAIWCCIRKLLLRCCR